MAKKKKKRGKGTKSPAPDKGDKPALKAKSSKKQENAAREFEEVRPKG
jgi:hypothetical protein